MKLRDCIEIKAGSGWGSERNVLGLIDTKNTPAHSIAGPAEEPTNWQMLGMTSIKLALEHNFNKHYIDPMAWMQLAVMAGGPGSGRHKEFGSWEADEEQRGKVASEGHKIRTVDVGSISNRAKEGGYLQSDKLREFKDKMRAGSKFPLVEVYDNGDKTYDIASGNHRHAAWAALGKTKIPVLVVPKGYVVED
jgi:hypothetical protein